MDRETEINNKHNPVCKKTRNVNKKYINKERTNQPINQTINQSSNTSHKNKERNKYRKREIHKPKKEQSNQ